MMNETTSGTYTETSGTPTASTYSSGQQPGAASTHAGATQKTGTFKTTLYRHPTEKLIGGVCGGLADYLGWDAALIRILWLVATIATGGGGLLAYLVLWGLLPVGTKETGVQQPAAFELNERNIGRVATILIGLGVLWLLSNLGILPRLWSIFRFTLGVVFWPALLIGIGYLLLRGSGNAKLDLNVDFGDLRNRFQNRMREMKSTNGSGVKSTLKQGRERLPLRRSATDRLFLGVCGGIGQRFGVDANLVRLLWAAFSIGSIGMGVLVYIVFGLLLPEETTTSTNGANPNHVQDVEIIEGTKPHTV